ncbi:phospholipase A2 inhibitor beta-like [Cydia pomonella]|uniref:phospholipase A2 inhibitor beta-like n=1 Tax=Cydia pomonella TaxID=82600 RepID=UPI002ADE152D|nr:phospholipase A2 inhibitor beta-like [Cydia pomonella]
MAAITFGPVSALLLAALFCAHADKVITRSCGTRGLGFRVRQYPTDTEATSLIADNCQLTDVGTADFNGLPYLTAIDLEQNDIVHIHPVAFRSVPRLMILDVNRNKLRDLPVFEDQSCPNLKVLNLRENQLYILNNSKALSACTKLEKIYLSKNNIEYLHPDLFSALTELKMLLLNNNKIIFIHDSLLLNNVKLEWLEVQNNRLTYLPNEITDGLKQINFDDNPWRCECLLELLKDIKKEGVKYNYWMYIGLRPKCVYTAVHACSRAPSGLLLPGASVAETR